MNNKEVTYSGDNNPIDTAKYNRFIIACQFWRMIGYTAGATQDAYETGTVYYHYNYYERLTYKDS